MPPTNDPPHRHLKKTPSGRRKSKPKFEIPAEAVITEAPVGWVYRAEEVLPPPAATEPPPTNVTPFLLAGMGLVFIGIGTMGLVSLAALELFRTPMPLMKAARRVFDLTGV